MKKGFISNRSTFQKKIYLILIGLAIISLLIGCFFIFVISKDNKIFIKDQIINFFSNITSSMSLFFKTLFNYYIYLLLIWILGISIIGLPIVLFMFLFKNFIIGFSISSVIYSYKTKGILISLIDIFPHKILFLIILLLMTFYSLSFSIKLIKHLFFKKPINFRESFNKYFRILIICLSTSIFIALYEIFIEPLLIKLL